MNSPDDDPVRPESELDYAPPWAREQAARDQGAAGDQFRAALRQSGGAAAEPGPQSLEDRTFADDRPWHQRALEPELVPEPPAGASNVWPMMLRLGLVCGLAALVAGAVVFLFNPKPVHKVAQASAPAIVADDAPPPAIETPAGVPALAVEASAASTPNGAPEQVAIPTPPIPEAPLPAAKPEAQVAPAPAQQIVSLPAPTVSPANIKSPPPPVNESAPQPVDAPPQAAPPAPQSAPKPVVELDENEINTLIRRGKNLLNDGDFAAARVLFERAANAGSAEAALALGSTYDPNVIKRLGALMVKPDIESARKWYQLAAERGSAAASLQLANLPQNR